MNTFKLKSSFSPTGDQPKAIEKLVSGIKSRKKFQTLLGVTGSGKTVFLSREIIIMISAYKKAAT